MVSLYVVVEGQTEQTFVDTVLGPHLLSKGIVAHAPLVQRRRSGVIYRGGVTNFPPVGNTIPNLTRQHTRPGVYFSSMLDLDKYPTDAPGWDDAKSMSPPRRRAEHLETALSGHISDHRFIPYIQVHEFEALLFTDPQWLAFSFPSQQAAIESLVTVAGQFASPEDINDSEQTAPSKRIIAAIPDYDYRKPTAGPQTAELIGLPAIRAKCPHFNAWVEKLERLAAPTTSPA
jgi:hypothetical protein